MTLQILREKGTFYLTGNINFSTLFFYGIILIQIKKYNFFKY